MSPITIGNAVSTRGLSRVMANPLFIAEDTEPDRPRCRLDKMSRRGRRLFKAYEDTRFLRSKAVRALCGWVLAEYLEPAQSLSSATMSRTRSSSWGRRGAAVSGGGGESSAGRRRSGPERAWRAAQMALCGCRSITRAARELAQRLTAWSKKLGQDQQRFVVCTGGGPGIMEAANRGASEANGLHQCSSADDLDPGREILSNPYVSRELPTFIFTTSLCANSGLL